MSPIGYLLLDDGNVCQLRPFVIRWGGWRLGCELVEVGELQVPIGSTGRGCEPGFVRVYRAIVHIGPLKLCFGSDTLDEEIELCEEDLAPLSGPPPLPVLPCL
jgi:hypothetical protein